LPDQDPTQKLYTNRWHIVQTIDHNIPIILSNALKSVALFNKNKGLSAKLVVVKTGESSFQQAKKSPAR